MIAVIARWMGPHKDIRLLQTIALLRGIGQGIALVDMSLLLKELGFSGGAIGAMLAAAGLAKTVATLFAGELNALLGARRYLLLYETVTFLAALTVSLTSNVTALGIAIVTAGLGSGHSGSGTPAAPIERSWLSAYARHHSKPLLNIHALLGYAGMGIGCLLACLPSLGMQWLAGPNAYRPVFIIIALLTAGCIALTLRISGGQRKPVPEPQQAPISKAPSSNEEISVMSKKEKSLEELTYFANLLGSITSSLSCIMTPYWFAVHFEASVGQIGAIMGLSYIAAGLMPLVFGGQDRRNTLFSVISLQLIGAALMLALPWAASLWIAAVLQIGCTACSLGTRSGRTVMMLESRRTGKRSLVSRINYVLIRTGAILWPSALGSLMDEGHSAAPFVIAAALQSFSTFLYAKIHLVPKEGVMKKNVDSLHK